MKYTVSRINNTDSHVFEALPSEGSLVLTRMYGKKKVNEFDHGWYETQGYEQVAAMNASYFYLNNVVGGLWVDSGFYVSPFLTDKKFITLIYQDDQLILDELDDYTQLRVRYPNANLMGQFGSPLVKDGKAYKGDGIFDHSYGRHPRSFIGQKASGAIVFFSTDGRGGNDRGFTEDELRGVAIDMGCVTAVNVDGGDSTTLVIENKMVNTNVNRPVPCVFMFYAKKGYRLTTKIAKPKKRIVLDAGHGMGTAGKRSPNGIREAQQNYNVMFRLYQLLSDDGEFDVMMTNDNMAEDMGINARVNLANIWGADLFLSIHKDAFRGAWDASLTGILTLVYGTSSPSVPIGKTIHNKLLDVTGMRDKKVRYRPDLGVLRLTKGAAVLVELGSMDDPSDVKQMTSAKWFDLYARALFEGIKDAL